MNRVIKFRAWDTKNQRMISAEEMGRDELQINPDGRGFFNASCIQQSMSQYYPHLLPMQFTGLEDKNGNDIYEGDIKREEIPHDTDEDLRLYFVCTWIKEWAMFAWLSTDGEYQNYINGGGTESLDMQMFCTYPAGADEPNIAITICGDIYRNPELL